MRPIGGHLLAVVSIIMPSIGFGCASDADRMAKGEEEATYASEAALAEKEATDSCGKACTPKECTPVAPGDALITDWKDLGENGLFVDNDSYTHPNGRWWEQFFGGPYVYPAADSCSAQAPDYPLTQTTNGVWNVRGTVGTWSGFGLWFAPCLVDFSRYRGVSFEIYGDVGVSHQLNFDVITSQNSKRDECHPNVGTCDPTESTCKSATTTFDVPTASGSTVTFLWSDFGSGSPYPGVDPSQIVGLHWAFRRVEWGGQKTDPFAVNVTMGPVRLVP